MTSGRARLRGSSPRVRGTGSNPTARAGTRWFIPACAGNGPPSRKLAGFRTVHPRVCGERASRIPSVTTTIGSSPRVRGTVVQLTDQAHPDRFIPACAGNGHSPRSSRTCSPVHPRVCGERSRVYCGMSSHRGSSPRVRGTASRHLGRPPHYRFIPACAGNGPSQAKLGRLAPVHPRVCGERISRHRKRR